ncbi:hypothetical protein [Streptomyces sp. NPDC002889]|uniref:hypothetical protein n=1 Tax=Streptomyces sp. NPDC002889 TaxID=3364669 RepID=UPI0036A510D1
MAAFEQPLPFFASLGGEDPGLQGFWGQLGGAVTHDSEHEKASRERRLSIGQAAVDWLMVVPAIVKFIEWVVSILQSGM